MAKHRVGLYPGTFDPPTLGHMDIITRAVKLVDHLVIGERYCARIGLEADFQSALGSDRLVARRAEPFGAALGRRSARAQNQRQQRRYGPH